MRSLLFSGVLAIVFSFSANGQGTIFFNNRNIIGRDQIAYHVPVPGDTTGAVAQLFLVTGAASAATYTPVPGQATFRTGENMAYFTQGVLATVPGHPGGTEGLNFVVRVWKGASFDTSSERIQTGIFQVGPLGGENPTGGLPFLPPDIGGANLAPGVGGLSPLGFGQGFTAAPEPSAYAIALCGAAAFFLRRRK